MAVDFFDELKSDMEEEALWTKINLYAPFALAVTLVGLLGLSLWVIGQRRVQIRQETSTSLYCKGLEYLEAGHHDQAVAAFDKINRDFPDSGPALLACMQLRGLALQDSDAASCATNSCATNMSSLPDGACRPTNASGDKSLTADDLTRYTQHVADSPMIRHHFVKPLILLSSFLHTWTHGTSDQRQKHLQNVLDNRFLFTSYQNGWAPLFFTGWLLADPQAKITEDLHRVGRSKSLNLPLKLQFFLSQRSHDEQTQ